MTGFDLYFLALAGAVAVMLMACGWVACYLWHSHDRQPDALAALRRIHEQAIYGNGSMWTEDELDALVEVIDTEVADLELYDDDYIEGDPLELYDDDYSEPAERGAA